MAEILDDLEYYLAMKEYRSFLMLKYEWDNMPNDERVKILIRDRAYLQTYTGDYFNESDRIRAIDEISKQIEKISG